MELVKEANQRDIKIESYIRNGFENHSGISISQETALHRKKLMGVLSDEEWDNYVDFIQQCIAKADETEQ